MKFYLHLIILVFTTTASAESLQLIAPDEIEGLPFGRIALQTALQKQGHSLSDSGAYTLSIAIDPDLPEQGFRLQHDAGNSWKLTAGDDAGAMYGLLELAEQIRLFDLTGVTSTSQAPTQQQRGIKYNIPLDVRTPSYTDPSDSAQHAMEESWNMDFWKEFIDRLAGQRYNLISLWNLHPFPSMVRVPEYPDVALDDVRRSTTKWDEMYSLQGIGYDAPEIVDQYETLRVMSIEEKIAFWRAVMAYARSRNIRIYIITWNTFVNGTDGKYGITDALDNPVTRDYFRASVRALFATYPDLAGIGLTTGENMQEATFDEKEDWAFETYGLGTLDAAVAEPDRKFTFVHRQHMTRASDIATRFQPLLDSPNIDFLFSFKYAQAHVMSAIRQPYSDTFLKDIPPLETLWTMRNDDNYVFRWGGAEFIREFLGNVPLDSSAGLYYGSDQWLWAREFLSTEPMHPRELELSKHWYHWMLWGRLAYDPDLPDERLVALLQDRFPGTDANKLFDAWNDASMTYPLTTGFHWINFDFQWYIEACQSIPRSAETPTGFHDINRFITLGTHPGSGNVSIPEYVEAIREGREISGTSPLEVSAQLLAHANRALTAIDEIDPAGNRELRRTLDDIRAMAYLGKYYGHKISAATALALDRAEACEDHRTTLASELNLATGAWRHYCAIALSQYRYPIWTNRVGHVDIRDTFRSVLYDLAICGVTPDIPSMEPTPGGIVLDAEDARTDIPLKNAIRGFTGSGYIDFRERGMNRTIEWDYDAPNTGTYILEFRHAKLWNREQQSAHLRINGEAYPEFELTPTGSYSTWGWDRAIVRLQAGMNSISIRPGTQPLIDHLNVLPTGEQ